MKRVKHGRTTQQIAAIIFAYLLLLSRRTAISMSHVAVCGQNLCLEIATTRRDGKQIFPSQSRVQTAKNDQKIDRSLY